MKYARVYLKGQPSNTAPVVEAQKVMVEGSADSARLVFKNEKDETVAEFFKDAIHGYTLVE